MFHNKTSQKVNFVLSGFIANATHNSIANFLHVISILQRIFHFMDGDLYQTYNPKTKKFPNPFMSGLHE